MVPARRQQARGLLQRRRRERQLARTPSSASTACATAEAKRVITAWLEQQGLGKKKHNTKLRDWLFSRQRYWGEPFPIVYDAEGNHHPVADDKLPLMLPELADYQPEESDDPKPLLGQGARRGCRPPRASAACASCRPTRTMTRETNTMPGWAGSCWYFLRYCDPEERGRADRRRGRALLARRDGVDLYIGGAEHAVLHLLYARFWHQVLLRPRPRALARAVPASSSTRA